MKNLFNSLFLIAAAAFMLACDGNKNLEDDDKKQESEYYEFPLNWQEDGFEAGDNGVTINVSSVEEKNIVFNLVPGASVKSYRLDVYPKAMLYNLLLNEGCLMTPAETCEDKVIQLLANSTGSGAYIFNAADDDFAAGKEFDWMNTEYSQAQIVPDCEYFILALGCYDENGENPASLSIAHVTTPAKELVGDPQIAIEAEVGYRAFIVKYHPNEDCKKFYHWIWSTEEIGEYIDLFGEKMMRDFCRSAMYDAYDAALEENLSVKRTFDLADGMIRENTAVAVALDANGTPSVELVRLDFELMQIPDGDFTPKATVKAGERICATLAYFDVRLDITAMSCFYRLYEKAAAETLKNASEDVRSAEAISIANEGWGVANKNFSFNSETNKLTGDSFSTSDEVQVELKPDTEYVVAYVAKNGFAQLSELCFSEPFKTKKLVRDNPDACIADVELTLTEVSRWGFKYNFKYDYATTACYRFQIVAPYDKEAPVTPPDYITDLGNREKWMTFFYDTYQEGPAGLVPIVNMWDAEKSGYDGYSMFGYDSGITYVVAYCAEDVNGVVGPVKFAQATTTQAVPGPDPIVSIEMCEYDDAAGQVIAKFKANEDTKMIKYFGVTSSDASLYASCALNDLVNSDKRDQAAYLTLWESQLVELGLDSAAESAIVTVQADKNSDKPVLVAAVAIGEVDGEDVYSPVACKIYHMGKFKDLKDFRAQ
ncbi:MAG: hypothetical protein J6A91_01355 [Bacteroidales bacterium]|nr:hypothetical protein [Bacteroidales bacterium]